jgi:hypothetical protein
MTTHWKLDEEDEKLREFVARATSDGPQQIEEEGSGAAVVISLNEFERLRGEGRREGSLVEFFRCSPLVGADLDLERDAHDERAPATECLA